MRTLALLLALAPPALADDGCWLLCSETYDLAGEEAAERLAGWLGTPIPPGTIVERYREEGFQDAYVRARLDADADGLAATLGALGLDASDLAAIAPAETVAEPAWWDWPSRDGVTTATGALPALPYVTLYVAPAGDARWTIWITGFQT